MPIAMAVEQTETESFGDGVWANSNFSATNYSSASYSIDNYFDGYYGCDGYCLNYNTSNVDNRMLQITFADTGITEIGFNVGAVDTSWHYNVFIKDSNGTSSNPDWVTYNNPDGSTVFEETYTAPTGYEIWRIEMNFSDYAIIDNFYYKYDDGITPLTIGAPTNQTATVDYENGTVTIDWDAPTDGNTSPERYAIAFGLNDEGTASPYGIATGNVGDENALNTEYTFTASYIQAVFNEAHGLFNTAIRSDNDTNSLYSSWTSTISTTIQNKPAKVSNLASSVDTSGDNLTITWDANDNGFVSASNYKIFSKTDETQWTQVLVTTNTSYSFKATETNSWEFRVDACGSEGDCNSSSTNVTFNYTVPTTTTTPTTLPPPPPPTTTTTTLPPVKEVVMDDGSTATYTEKQIAEGDVERDNERKANQEKWGCYVTNIALQRGDCEAYNKAIAEPEEEIIEEEIVEEIVEEVIVEEEVKDEKIVEEIFEDKPEDNIIDDTVVEDIKTEEIKDEEIIEEEPIDDKPVEIIEEDKPIKEDFPDEEIGLEPIKTDPLPSEEGDKKVQPTEVLVKETEAKVKEVVVIEVIEDEPVEEFEAKVEQAVKELPKEKKVEVVKEVAKVSVQNLATADNTTKAVVKAVVKEVTKPETVAELSEEEKVEVGKVLGFKDEETAAKDVEIIAEQAIKEKNVATAVEEYVDRAIENKDVENYTLADVITEVQVEAFLENPVGALLDVNIIEMDWSSVGSDMTSDQKEKAQEVVVPVIIASQIISSAGALMTRRF